MFNRARFNGARFNGAGAGSILFSAAREPDFRVLTLSPQEFALLVQMQDFSLRVAPQSAAVAAPPRAMQIEVRKD